MTDSFPRKVISGQHLVVDDRSGFTRWSGEIVREDETGFMVERGHADPIHPQERGPIPLPERQSVRNARPPGTYDYLGPLTTEVTADAAAGDTSVTVSSNVRFHNGDHLRIALSSGEFQDVDVVELSGSTIIVFTGPLKENVSSGALVVNRSAIATPNLS